MKKIPTTLAAIFMMLMSYSQTKENDALVELAKSYSKFMFRSEPPKGYINEMETGMPESLTIASKFIVQTITTDNDILEEEYLTLPDSQSLKNIYIIRELFSNMRGENPIDNKKLIDSVRSAQVPKVELVDCYYSILFVAAGNKNQPFNLSKVDFNLKNYKLSNDTEKGIFFLQCMDYCGTIIWGYMNVVNPPNTKLAYDYIKKYPKFNGLEYYEFTDLNFPDFEMLIDINNGVESYKGYYINKYYDLLLSHLICLNKENPKEELVNDLLLGSILKDSKYYKYSKNKELLESIFQEQKQD